MVKVPTDRLRVLIERRPHQMSLPLWQEAKWRQRRYRIRSRDRVSLAVADEVCLVLGSHLSIEYPELAS